MFVFLNLPLDNIHEMFTVNIFSCGVMVCGRGGEGGIDKPPQIVLFFYCTVLGQRSVVFCFNFLFLRGHKIEFLLQFSKSCSIFKN